MPFQPQNYADIAPQGNPWVRDFVENLAKGYKAGRLPYETGQEEQKNQLANAWQEMLNKEQPQKFASDQKDAELKQAFQAMLNQEQPAKFGSDQATSASTRAFQDANTNRTNTMLPLDVIKQNLANHLYTKLTNSQIDSNEAMANFRNTGGSGGSVDQKNEQYFEQLVGKDNPNIPKEKIYEAANVLRSGGNTLSDGTKINPLSPASNGLWNDITKRGTTAPLITQGVGAAQASAEYLPLNDTLKSLNNTIGATLGSQSPSAVINSYLSGSVGDDKMAAIIARGQLASASATLQNRTETGQSFATIIKEILDRSKSDINADYAKVTPNARNKAIDIVTNTMNKMYEARKNVPIGAASAVNANAGKTGNSGRVFNLGTGAFE